MDFSFRSVYAHVELTPIEGISIFGPSLIQGCPTMTALESLFVPYRTAALTEREDGIFLKCVRTLPGWEIEG